MYQNLLQEVTRVKMITENTHNRKNQSNKFDATQVKVQIPPQKLAFESPKKKSTSQ